MTAGAGPQRPPIPPSPPQPVDVLIPTRNRPAALALTLSGLAGQDLRGLRVVVADQSDGEPACADPHVQAMVRWLRARGIAVELFENLPRRGLAHQRAALLERAEAPLVLYLDDDVWLEPGALGVLRAAMARYRCGFVGMPVVGLGYLDDVRPQDHVFYEEWGERVEPERVEPGTPAWQRHRLHNAATPAHLAQRLELAPGEWRAYKVAWIGACVLYDRAKLLAAGGFDFWSALPPEHAGEDVAAQLAVMERFGGAGVLPSGAVHLELATTVPDREVEVHEVVRDGPPRAGQGSV